MPYRIDVHHHIFPDFYVKKLQSIGIQDLYGVPFPRWEGETAIRIMDKNRIATGMATLSAPGVYFKDREFSRKLARECNEYTARLMDDYPSRFGGIASLPLPDVRGSLIELEYALDTLGLDGIGLLSNVDGHYLGDSSYEELFAELDRRRAVVFIHPIESPGSERPYLGPPLEFCHDTTRTVMNMLYSGFLERFPRVRFLLSHSGGTIPYMAWRIALGSGEAADRTSFDKGMFDHVEAGLDPEPFIRLLRGMYYDTLSGAGPHGLRSLQRLVDPSHILLGTDYAALPGMLVFTRIKAVTSYDGFDDETQEMVERLNALELFPRLKEFS